MFWVTAMAKTTIKWLIGILVYGRIKNELQYIATKILLVPFYTYNKTLVIIWQYITHVRM